MPPPPPPPKKKRMGGGGHYIYIYIYIFFFFFIGTKLKKNQCPPPPRGGTALTAVEPNYINWTLSAGLNACKICQQQVSLLSALCYKKEPQKLEMEDASMTTFYKQAS